MDNQTREDLRELFAMLDYAEDRGEGRTIRRTEIHTSSTPHLERLEIILPRLREAVRAEDAADQEAIDAFAPKKPSVYSINYHTRIAILTDDTILPITDFYDSDGNDCEPISAAACVAGREGMWFAIDTSKFNAGTMH